MQGIPNDGFWRIFTQLIYETIDTEDDKPEEIVMKMKAHIVW
jgi:hypothetical protein